MDLEVVGPGGQLVVPARIAAVNVKVSDAIHADLRRAILTGELAPGDALPSERELAERRGVNRHAVREAVNRLQQARLVQVSHGGPTRVLDWGATGGLDLLTDLAFDQAAELDPDILRAIVEMRACVGIDAARRCAERGEPSLREDAAAVADEIAAEPDLERRAARYLDLWALIVAGAGNLAYRLGLNTLNEGLALRPAIQLQLVPTPGDAPALRSLAAGLRDGDAPACAAAARELLDRPLTA